MTDPIEKAARAARWAVQEQWLNSPRGEGLMIDGDLAFARAVIRSLAEPSDAMIAAGTEAWSRYNHGAPYTGEVRAIWLAMMRAALEERDEG